MGGFGAEPTVKTGSSQWPEITRIAFGRSGRPATRPFSQAAVLSQVSAGPRVHSMKKQGPAPCGMKRVGSVIGNSSAWLASGRDPFLGQDLLDPGAERLAVGAEELGGGLIDQLAVRIE